MTRHDADGPPAAASARSRPVKPETPSPGPAGALSLSRTQIGSDTESDRRDPTQWQALAASLNLNLPVTRSRARVTSLSYEYLESDSDSKHFRLFGRMRSLNLKLQVKFHRVLVTVTGRTRVAGPPSSGCGPAPHRTGIAANPGLYLNFSELFKLPAIRVIGGEIQCRTWKTVT